MASEWRPSLKKLSLVILAASIAAFAIEGGEYGTRDLWRQRQEERRLRQSIDSLTGVVDSMRRYESAVEHDPATQERIAREVFGMVRGDKELLYRFAEAGKPAR